MKLPPFIIPLSVLSIVPAAGAQEMVTDRPDFTESALSVPTRTVQIESGAEYADFGGRATFSYPNSLARVGVGHRLEVRLGFAGWTSIETNAQTRTHLNDLHLEAKYQLTNDSAALPMALLLVSTLPTGNNEISAGSFEMGAKFVISRALSEGFELTANVGAISVDPGGGRELLALASVALGVDLNARFGAFAELFAEVPQGAPWQPVADGGVTFLLLPGVQLDLYLGKGLNNHATDVFLGTGLSFRFGY